MITFSDDGSHRVNSEVHWGLDIRGFREFPTHILLSGYITRNHFQHAPISRRQQPE